MNEYIFWLFFPSIGMLFAWFVAWLFFEKIPEIYDRIFGEHTVLVAGLKTTTIERRRNFDNKLTSSKTYPNYSYLMSEYCGYTTTHTQNTQGK